MFRGEPLASFLKDASAEFGKSFSPTVKTYSFVQEFYNAARQLAAIESSLDFGNDNVEDAAESSESEEAAAASSSSSEDEEETGEPPKECPECGAADQSGTCGECGATVGGIAPPKKAPRTFEF